MNDKDSSFLTEAYNRVILREEYHDCYKDCKGMGNTHSECYDECKHLEEEGAEEPSEAPIQEDEGSRWTEEGLLELEPNELLEFISDSLPKFLQTHFNPQDYDEIKRSLFNAAVLLNDPYGPGGQEYDDKQKENPVVSDFDHL